MKKIEKDCENKCPKCGSIEINWGCYDIQDYGVTHGVTQSGTCLVCGCEFEEESKMVYTLTTYEE